MAYMISLSAAKSIICLKMLGLYSTQGCISCGTCSYLELTEDHVLTSAYVKIFRIVTRNAVNKSFWRKKDCSWPPLNKYAMNIWLSSLRIRAHLSWRTGKHLHVLHVLRTYSTCSCPGQQDTTTYAALGSRGPWGQTAVLQLTYELRPKWKKRRKEKSQNAVSRSDPR